MQFGVNHLGHFLLTSLLLDQIKEAPAGRIVVVSSLGHIRTKKINFDDINSTQIIRIIVCLWTKQAR